MKIARVRLPGQQGPTVGLVDEARSEILDAGQVIQQLGLAVDASTAVELVRHNTEHAGALSDAVKDLSQFSVTRWPVDSLRFLCPIEAGSLKDFLAFEVHLSNARKRNNMEIPPAWYDLPVYYKGNHRTLGGHDELVYWPRFSEQMDYELELACIIGKEGIDIPVEHADQYIGGYCIMNDWSARDIQMKEMSVGLGPAKGKDFATSMGPWLVTPTSSILPQPAWWPASTARSGPTASIPPSTGALPRCWPTYPWTRRSTPAMSSVRAPWASAVGWSMDAGCSRGTWWSWKSPAWECSATA